MGTEESGKTVQQEVQEGEARLRASLEGWEDQTPPYRPVNDGVGTLTPDVMQSEDGRDWDDKKPIIIVPTEEELEQFDWACSQNPNKFKPRSPLNFYNGGVESPEQENLRRRIEAAKQGIEVVGPI